MDDHHRSESWFDPANPYRYYPMQNWIGADRPSVSRDATDINYVADRQISVKTFLLIAVPFVGIVLGTLIYQFACLFMGYR